MLSSQPNVVSTACTACDDLQLLRGGMLEQTQHVDLSLERETVSCLPRLQAPLLRGGMETKKDDDTESRGGCPICQPRETIPKSERMELKAFALKSFGFGVVKVSFSIWHLE